MNPLPFTTRFQTSKRRIENITLSHRMVDKLLGGVQLRPH